MHIVSSIQLRRVCVQEYNCLVDSRQRHGFRKFRLSLLKRSEGILMQQAAFRTSQRGDMGVHSPKWMMWMYICPCKFVEMLEKLWCQQCCKVCPDTCKRPRDKKRKEPFASSFCLLSDIHFQQFRIVPNPCQAGMIASFAAICSASEAQGN